MFNKQENLEMTKKEINVYGKLMAAKVLHVVSFLRARSHETRSELKPI